MIPKAFDQIKAADIQALIQARVGEGKTLEYKQELPGKNDKEKKFLSNVISFANAAGGDILYGIVEERDADGKTTGIPKDAPGLDGINADEEIRRLESMIHDSIEPRIPGTRIKPIPGFPKGPVLIIRIPQSWMAPHLVRISKGLYRISTRSSAGKRPLDVTELRSLFVASASLKQRIQNIRDGRLAKIVAGETPVPIPQSPTVILHIIPVRQVNSDKRFDPRSIYTYTPQSFAEQYPKWKRLNFDGLLFYWQNGKGQTTEYFQFFRTGHIEVVNTDIVYEEGESTYIYTEWIEKGIVQQGFQYLQLLRRLEIDPPIIFLISFWNVKNLNLVNPRTVPNGVLHVIHTGGNMRIDRDMLTLPEILLDSYPTEAKELAQLFQDTFDILWQTAGWKRSLSYDENGNWKEQ